MEVAVKAEHDSPLQTDDTTAASSPNPAKIKSRSRKKSEAPPDPTKRRCVSTACIACRRRKSKASTRPSTKRLPPTLANTSCQCDGNLPACAACSSVYGTDCVYDPNSDHRRKGVYKKDIDNLKTRSSTLQTLVHAILNYPQDDVSELVRQIRSCESLDKVAEAITARDAAIDDLEQDVDSADYAADDLAGPSFESHLSSKMGKLQLEDGSVRFIGGTSNLVYLPGNDLNRVVSYEDGHQQQKDPITSWTTITSDPDVIMHLLNMYFTWHYTFFTTLSKSLFYRDFLLGRPPSDTRRKVHYCTPLLVNAMLALGCHFSASPAAREDPQDSATTGDHYFKEAKRLMMEDDELEKPTLATVQALALMSVREAGCGREAKGWVYSGISFRMACDLGLNYHPASLSLTKEASPDEEEDDARRITFWGCFLFDKCWSNYLGRLPTFISANITAPKFEVLPMEDAETWAPYTDSGFSQMHSQPSRVRAVALQISALCDISSDLMKNFYHPSQMDRPIGKQVELMRLSDIHTRLESWRRQLPKEMEPREGGLSSVLVMHMLFQLLFIHLFRPFLKYNQASSPLPTHVSPRKLCTQAAGTISKLLRVYKRSYGLRQICNIAVYIAHSACTIHLLNLPEKNAMRDFTHGVKHLEEIAESWLCARRTLKVLSTQARKWQVELPEEAAGVLERTDDKFRQQGSGEHEGKASGPASPLSTMHKASQEQRHEMRREEWDGEELAGTSNGYIAEAVHTPLEHPLSRIVSGTSSSTMPGEKQSQAHYPRPGQYVGTSMSAFAATLSPGRQQQQQQQQQQAQPHHQQQQRPRQAPAMPARQHSGMMPALISPTSGMFGGVEALLREGMNEDWWVKDQSQVASGFDNWGGLHGDSHLQPQSQDGGQRQSQQQQQQQQQQVGFPAHGLVPGLSGFGMGTSIGLAGVEDEWY